MMTATTLHSELVRYCAANGIEPSSFGVLLFGNAKFADRLRRGTTSVEKATLAARFMVEHPEVPRRKFGAVARAWRDRVTAEGDIGAGARHADATQAVAGAVGSITAATLEQLPEPHNQESQSSEGGS